MDFKHRKFDSRVKPGTKVLIEWHGWHVVKSIHHTRKWIQTEGFNGSFQRRHVLKFTNR